MVQPRPLLSFIFGLFKQTSLQILQNINVKNVHPVYSARIWTHNLRNMSLLPLPPGQGSHPKDALGICNLYVTRHQCQRFLDGIKGSWLYRLKITKSAVRITETKNIVTYPFKY